MVDQVTAREFADRLDAGESVTIVDTRDPDSFESWHLPGATNVPYDPREGADADQLDRVDAAADRPVVTVCERPHVVGSRAAAEAVVVDPTRRTDVFQVAAERAGLAVAGVLDTHVHADHIPGGRDLAETLEVPSFMGERTVEGDAEATELEVGPNNCAA